MAEPWSYSATSSGPYWLLSQHLHPGTGWFCSGFTTLHQTEENKDLAQSKSAFNDKGHSTYSVGCKVSENCVQCSQLCLSVCTLDCVATYIYLTLDTNCRLYNNHMTVSIFIIFVTFCEGGLEVLIMNWREELGYAILIDFFLYKSSSIVWLSGWTNSYRRSWMSWMWPLLALLKAGCPDTFYVFGHFLFRPPPTYCLFRWTSYTMSIT